MNKIGELFTVDPKLRTIDLQDTLFDSIFNEEPRPSDPDAKALLVDKEIFYVAITLNRGDLFDIYIVDREVLIFDKTIDVPRDRLHAAIKDMASRSLEAIQNAILMNAASSN